MKIFYILIITLISSTVLKAEIQKTSKFGKISNKEIESSVCPIDSSAQGYYLFDVGSTNFVYRQTVTRSDDAGSSKGFQMTFKRHLRLKILDKAATSNGDVEIKLYKSGSNEEKLINIKGLTYNLEGGKVHKTKLDTKQVIYEKQTDNITIVKIPMPNVREGSVIDLEYEILSDFLFNLQGWYFQRRLPVMYSEYKVSIPEYFYYKPATYGYFAIKRKSTSHPKSIRFTYIQRADETMLQEGRYEHEEKYHDKVTTYYMSNIPAFKPEQYLRSQRNYLSRISFELEGTRFPRTGYKSFSTSWEQIAKKLLESENFGNALSRGNFLNVEAKQINNTYENNEEKIVAAFSLVQSKLRWNNKERLFASNSLKKTWEEGGGNSADINLCLIALLRNMGFSAYPVVLSTQRNGVLPLTHPSITDLNYVIAMVEANNKIILMDASSPTSYLNRLPERCLNGKGQIIDASRFGSIDIKSNAPHFTNIKMNLKMQNNGSFNGMVELKKYNYARMDDIIQNQNDSLYFVKQLEKKYPGLKISKHSIHNLKKLDSELIDSMQVTIEGWTDVMGGMMVFSPLLTFKISDNPFKLENRDYPIEFSYPMHHRVICQIEIPEGYVIESLPNPIKVAMPDDDIELNYTIRSNKNIIQITSDFKINKLLFLPVEYEAVKETFSYLINKHNEKVVIKRL